MTMALSNVGHSTKEEMLEDVAEISLRRTVFVVVATYLAHKYPERFGAIELLKMAAREGMGWNSNQYTPEPITITEDGEKSYQAEAEVYCPCISVNLQLRAKLEYNDQPENAEDDDQDPVIDEVRLVSVSVWYGSREMVIEEGILEQSINALCNAEAFPIDMMSKVATLWQR